MDKKVIVNIDREFGSDGHEVGKKLAEKLNVPFYDNEFLDRASKESGISKDILQVVDEQHTKSFLFSIATGSYSGKDRLSAAGTVSLSDRLYMIYNDMIKRIAKEGSCVIVGRCSDYILRDEVNSFNFFVYADLESRVKTTMQKEGLDDKKARDYINKVDKKRSNYYNYYTNQKWGHRHFYDMLINSGELGIEGSVDIIIKYIELKVGELT